MKLVIVSLAPRYPTNVREAIAARWPEVDLTTVPVVTFYGYSRDGRLFDIPRHIPLGNLPIHRPIARRKGDILHLRKGIEDAPNEPAEFDVVREVVTGADEVLLLCSDDMAAIGGAHDFLVDMFGVIPCNRVIFPRQLVGWSARANYRHKEIVLEAGDFETEAGEVARAAQISSYFDYNYVLNATPILGAVARTAGLEGNAPSAFGLQLLYWLAPHEEPWSLFHLTSEVLANWNGSGKYTDRGGMGSMRSRTRIAERLVSGGFLVRDWPSNSGDSVRMTSAGRRFLSLLHKDCRDPDLPLRLRQWQDLPFDQAQRRVYGYIKAFFGKQVRMTRRPSVANS